jgi:hypothetical protein
LKPPPDAGMLAIGIRDWQTVCDIAVISLIEIMPSWFLSASVRGASISIFEGAVFPVWVSPDNSVALDLARGADLVLVKPGESPPKVPFRVEVFRAGVPCEISGECSRICAAAKRGPLDGKVGDVKTMEPWSITVCARS